MSAASELPKTLRRFIETRTTLDRLKADARRRCPDAADADPFDGSPGQPPCWYRKDGEPPATEAEMCGDCTTRQRARKDLPNARRRERRAFENLAVVAYREKVMA